MTAEARKWFYRGNRAAKTGKPERAIRQYSRAIEIDPGYAPAYFNRGLEYDEIRDSERAMVARGIWVALYTTAVGLLVAIPAIVAEWHFRALAGRYFQEIQDRCSRLAALLPGSASAKPEEAPPTGTAA